MPCPPMLRSLARAGSAWALLLCLVAGCGGDSLTLDPFQPEVSNATDNFALQATGVLNAAGTNTYTWRNTGTRASINHSTTTQGGSARLVIKDAAGTTVYDKALVPSLNEPTAAGAAGTWSVQLIMTSYSGTLNFRAQKL